MEARAGEDYCYLNWPRPGRLNLAGGKMSGMLDLVGRGCGNGM